MDYTYSLANGLGIIKQYVQAQQCVANTSTLVVRYQSAIDGFNNPPGGSEFQAWLEMALTIGNTSLWFKGCYENSETSIYNLYYYIMDYKSINNYIIYFLPNMLSYAFVINTWISKMNTLQ